MENVKKLTEFIPEKAVEYARKTVKIGIFGVKNNFVLAGILLIGYCVIAPSVFIAATTGRTSVSELAITTIMGIYSVIAAYVGGLLIPAVMFDFVHKRRDRDFFHSMPVRRGQYFMGYVAAGFVMFAVPYLLMCIVMGLLSGHGGIAFSLVLQSLALYLVIYASVTFSIMFSGSILSSLVTLTFLNAFPAIVVYCSLLLNMGLDSYSYITMLTPYIYIFTPLSGGYTMYDSFVNQGLFGWVLWVQLGIAVIELVLAYIMYKFRRGETTMAVAFPKTRYILQYGVMFLVAFFCTSLFSTIYVYTYDLSFHLTTEAVIMTVVMTFAAFVILNMILEQSFRAAFHKIRHLLIFGAAYVVVVAVLVTVVGSLPHWVVPIRTDAVLIHQTHYLSTYDEPADAESLYGFYTDEEGHEYSYAYDSPSTVHIDGDGNKLYHYNLGEERWMVTDPEQVAELVHRINDFMNRSYDPSYYYENHDYFDKVYYSEGDFYFVSFTLYTLKPGQQVEKGMYVDEMNRISSNSYGGGLDYMPLSERESLTSGMDMMRMYYRYEEHSTVDRE